MNKVYMNQPVRKDTEIVYFIRLHVLSTSIQSYNVIFRYNKAKMMNLLNQCLIVDLNMVIYHNQMGFYNLTRYH